MIHLYTDGSAQRNPGYMSIGVLLVTPNKVLVKKIHRNLNYGTNNQAEVLALIEGVNQAVELGYKEVNAYTDSELLANHYSGAYKIKDAKLRELHHQLKFIIKKLNNFSLQWHRRTEHLAQAADDLSKGIDLDLEKYGISL